MFGFNFFPGKETGIVPASWTLGVEMVFYVFLPILLLVATTWARSLALLAVAVVLAYFWQFAARLIDSDPASTYHYYSFPHQLPVFVFGMFCYHASRAIQPKHVGLGYVLIACAILGQAAIAVADVPSMGYYLQAAVFVPLLLGQAMTPVPLVVNRASRFLGTISYSLYLHHVTVILLLTPVFHCVYHDVSWSGGFFLSALILFSVLLPLSYLTYRFIEKPGMRMGERIIRTIVAASQVRPASDAR